MTQDYHQYNGWTNRATWLVPLWIDNEPATYHEKLDFIRNNDITPATVELFVRSLVFSDMLTGLEDDLADEDSEDSSYGHRASDIDWSEIAEHWIEEKKEMAE